MTAATDVKCIALFNNKGGVGKTSLVYHLAWMYADLGYTVVAADLDPQANLTSMFLSDKAIEALWEGNEQSGTIYASLAPLLTGTGDIEKPRRKEPVPGLRLVAGDMRLSNAEDELSSQWPRCLDRQERAFRILSAIRRALQKAAVEEEPRADLVLVDVGPNLGALNRAALIASDYVVVPLAPDLYSLQGLRNLGPALRRWKKEWAERRKHNPAKDLHVPRGDMQPVGYVVLQHAVRMDRPVQVYERWMQRIPDVYREHVLSDAPGKTSVSLDKDPHCLGSLRHYRSLMPLAQEARKPIFSLKPADGAFGTQGNVVRACHTEFHDLARRVALKCEIAPPRDMKRR